MKKSIIKNNNIHTTGDTNQRVTRCKHCNEPMEIGKAFKIVNSSTYMNLHKACIKDFFNDDYQRNQKDYKNDFRFDLRLWATTDEIDYLKMLGFKPNGFNNSIAIKNVKTLNVLKILKSLDTLSNVKVTITNGITNEQKTIGKKNIDAETFYKLIVSTSKELGIYK